MSLFFRNNTPNTLYVVIAGPDSDCSPTPLVKAGYYPVQPGRSTVVWNGSVANTTFYYYAFDTVGNTWSGNFFTRIPTDRAFNMCWVADCGVTNCRTVGLRSLPIGNFTNFTLTLFISNSKTKVSSKNNRMHNSNYKIRHFKFKLSKKCIARSSVNGKTKSNRTQKCLCVKRKR
ncbi:DUF1036 domain-containing protein [Ammoniphilus resinae]|uniref:DUF1036 domain-containing protein n=1 Tax=Ammoniphilus resinae TaxID=861532 RepID=A0ABS4GW39_9BACL|nr:hypothetical protein [Ammoniphilus resinae]